MAVHPKKALEVDQFLAGATPPFPPGKDSKGADKSKERPNKTTISLGLDPALLASIDKAAERRGISRAALIAIACSDFLGRA